MLEVNKIRKLWDRWEDVRERILTARAKTISFNDIVNNDSKEILDKIYDYGESDNYDELLEYVIDVFQYREWLFTLWLEVAALNLIVGGYYLFAFDFLKIITVIKKKVGLAVPEANEIFEVFDDLEYSVIRPASDILQKNDVDPEPIYALCKKYSTQMHPNPDAYDFEKQFPDKKELLNQVKIIFGMYELYNNLYVWLSYQPWENYVKFRPL